MLKDFAHGVVIPEFTDERLKSLETAYSSDFAALFLRAPADQRQNVSAEASARSVKEVMNYVTGRSDLVSVRDARETIEEVLRENGW